ncbi:glycine cleavage system protein GcvH [Limibacillus sp. MBR-115]|jgi:glycine cleavage system H protein|uniref:glycine cleavage system protein GcvH n=1 Tax=Limibacillus sp. MBR-115 TaxID=3156465 RepID=UPI0033981C75
MSSIKFSEDHEWVVVEGDVGKVGITNYAQEQLGDVVHVELPEVGRSLSKGDEAAVIDSVKAASEVYAPVDGEISEINESLADDFSKVNSDPQGDGWFFKIKMSDASQLDGLMDQAAYDDFIAGL